MLCPPCLVLSLCSLALVHRPQHTSTRSTTDSYDRQTALNAKRYASNVRIAWRTFALRLRFKPVTLFGLFAHRFYLDPLPYLTNVRVSKQSSQRPISTSLESSKSQVPVVVVLNVHITRCSPNRCSHAHTSLPCSPVIFFLHPSPDLVSISTGERGRP